MHTMAHRTSVRLGSPIPNDDDWRTQPYPEANGKIGKPALGRKPIVRISLLSGRHQDNPYGQARLRWRMETQADIERVLKTLVAKAINACDDFEIMLSIPGGNYKGGEIFHSNVFTSGMNRGEPDDQPMIREGMWDAMANVWLAYNLGEASPINGYGVPRKRKRRGWFYTGSGFAMLPDAAPQPTGHMNSRNIAPATGDVYYNVLMQHWKARDPDAEAGNRYRCFMLDQAGVWRGMLIPMCKADILQDNGFIFVGEAIAAGDDRARKGAVWYGGLDHTRSPWWNRNPNGRYDRTRGYNTQWMGDWETMPVYFSVSNGEYPYLYLPPPPPASPNPGTGDNMTIGDIYRFILKGATPFAQHSSVLKKVGAAWNYATGRLPMNRWDRWGKVSRWQR